MEKNLKGITECCSQLSRVRAWVVTIDGTTLLWGKFKPALLKNSDRPRWVHASANLLTIEGRLTKVVEERYDYQALTWEAEDITLEHSVEYLQTMHHESVVSTMMAMTLCRGQVVAALDEVDHCVDTWTVDF